MGKKVVLLLTGTINPNNMSFTKLQDADSRKIQYIDAIRFWLKKVDLPIVFVENSNTSIASYFKAEIAADRLELLHFQGNDYTRNLGKGYGELLCLEHANCQSRHIREADFIFKVTGRHKILNFAAFYNQFVSCPDISVMVNFYGFLKNCDSRFFGYLPALVSDYLIHYKDVVNDSKDIYFETILSNSVHKAIADGYKFRPFRSLPRIQGSSGTFGIKYKSNYFSWLRHNTEYRFKQSVLK